MSRPDPSIDDGAAETAVRWVVSLSAGEMKDLAIRRLQAWLGESERHQDEFRTACRLWAGLLPEAFGERRLPDAVELAAHGMDVVQRHRR